MATDPLIRAADSHFASLLDADGYPEEAKANGKKGSVQAHIRGDGKEQGSANDFGNAMEHMFIHIAARADGSPPYSYFPARRDRWLRAFSRSESVLAGGIYTIQSQIEALDYKVESDIESRKKYTQNLLQNADNGAGLQSMASKIANDLMTQDNGAFIELWGSGRADRPLVGPVQGLAHMDSAQCYRTFDPEYPVVYLNPVTQKYQKLHESRVIALSSMTQPSELARGMGFSAVSRALFAAQYMRNVWRFKDEKVSGEFTRAIGYGKNITGKQFHEAMTTADQNNAARGFVIYKKIPFIFPHGQGLGDIELKLLDLASVPDGFVFMDELTMYVYLLALCFGTDARDFWPSTQTGATKADATVQNMKARGKGKGEIIQKLERAFNWRVLPRGVEMHYDFVDDEQDETRARINNTKATYFGGLVTAQIINPATAQAHLVAEGVLKAELIVADPVTGTTVGSEQPPPTQPAPDDPNAAEDAEPATSGSDEVEGSSNPTAKRSEGGYVADERVKAVLADDPFWLERASKAIQATRLNFESDVEDLIAAARQSEINRRRFAGALRSRLRKYGTLAFIDGLNDGGVEGNQLDTDDKATINAMLGSAGAHITGLGDVIFSEEGLTDALTALKPSLWFNKTVYPLYEAGRLSADKNGMYEWSFGRTREHCKDCARLVGQIHRLKAWHARGLLPKSDKLECGGFLCDCSLKKSSGKARGNF